MIEITKTSIMNKTLTLLLLFAGGFTLFAQEELHKSVKNCQNEELPDVIFNFPVTGSIEYNASDEKRGFKGYYKDGVKNGTWSYYDSNGKLMEKRKHTDNFNFTSSNKASKLSTSLTKDQNGVIPFHHVKERDVIWSARFYQFIDFSKVENVEWDVLKQALEAILVNSATVKFESSELKDQIEFEAAQLADYSLVGYITKNECFVDQGRMITDQRVLAIQLVGKNVKTGQLEPMPAMYYPHIREALANYNVSFGKKLVSMDEVFFYNLLTGPANQFTSKSPVNYFYGKPITDLECFFYSEYSRIIYDSEIYLTSLIERNLGDQQ